MSARRSETKTRDDAGATRVLTPRPFKSRRGLFMLFAVANLVWIGVLLAMYFTTVRRQYDHPDLNPATLPGASTLPSAPR